MNYSKILDMTPGSCILKGLEQKPERSPTVTIFCVRKLKTDGEAGTREGRKARFWPKHFSVFFCLWRVIHGKADAH
jgi:hypothetical protein